MVTTGTRVQFPRSSGHCLSVDDKVVITDPARSCVKKPDGPHNDTRDAGAGTALGYRTGCEDMLQPAAIVPAWPPAIRLSSRAM